MLSQIARFPEGLILEIEIMWNIAAELKIIETH